MPRHSSRLTLTKRTDYHEGRKRPVPMHPCASCGEITSSKCQVCDGPFCGTGICAQSGLCPNCVSLAIVCSSKETGLHLIHESEATTVYGKPYCKKHAGIWKKCKWCGHINYALFPDKDCDCGEDCHVCGKTIKGRVRACVSCGEFTCDDCSIGTVTGTAVRKAADGKCGSEICTSDVCNEGPFVEQAKCIEDFIRCSVSGCTNTVLKKLVDDSTKYEPNCFSHSSE